MRRFGRLGLWLCHAALALMFLFAGVAKFASPARPRMFARWGYPDHFCIVIGVVGVAAGLALLVPSATAPAALVLIVIMIGAGLTHIVHAELQRLRKSSSCLCCSSSSRTGGGPLGRGGRWVRQVRLVR